MHLLFLFLKNSTSNGPRCAQVISFKQMRKKADLQVSCAHSWGNLEASGSAVSLRIDRLGPIFA
jgi:hypothetical protein